MKPPSPTSVGKRHKAKKILDLVSATQKIDTG